METDIIEALIVLAFLGIFCYKMCKKCKNDIEKVTFIAFAVVFIILLLIYFLDRYNIPTRAGLNTNLNTQNWLDVLSNHSVGIGSALISGVLLVVVTRLEIDRNNEDNIRRDAENMRVQNIPILKYYLNVEEYVPAFIENFIETKFEEGNTYNLNINIKNIGLNNIKNMKVDFESDILKKPIERLLGKDSVVVMEKGEEINIRKNFLLEHSEQPYKMTVIVYYQDVLGNWYSQILEMDYVATNRVQVGVYIGEVKYVVNEEKLLDINSINKL